MFSQLTVFIFPGSTGSVVDGAITVIGRAIVPVVITVSAGTVVLFIAVLFIASDCGLTDDKLVFGTPREGATSGRLTGVAGLAITARSSTSVAVSLSIFWRKML